MVVKISNLVKRYGDLIALDHLNIQINEGEIFGLLGPNGSGKTTAINCILSLLKYFPLKRILKLHLIVLLSLYFLLFYYNIIIPYF